MFIFMLRALSALLEWICALSLLLLLLLLLLSFSRQGKDKQSFSTYTAKLLTAVRRGSVDIPTQYRHASDHIAGQKNMSYV